MSMTNEQQEPHRPGPSEQDQPAEGGRDISPPPDDDRSPIPESHRDLLAPALIVHLATVREDGSPQSNPVWFEWDGSRIKLSQTTGRQKFRNMSQHPHVAMSVVDPQNPYRYLEIRGEVERTEPDPDNEFIDGLSERYFGERPYPYHQPGDERVVIYVRPTHCSAMG